MARRRFFVDEIRNGQAELVGGAAQHLARVLRAQPGQQFEISDNRDLFLAEVTEVAKGRVSMRVVRPLAPEALPLRIGLFPALIKFNRFEWMIEKATELGIERIAAIEAERSEKGLGEAAHKRIERWRKIARESAEQSRRARLPEIHAPIALETALAEQSSYRFYLEEESGAPALAAALPGQNERHSFDTVHLFIGPEGGWTERERQQFRLKNCSGVSLGPQILRAETAAIAALAVLIHAWWGMGRSKI